MEDNAQPQHVDVYERLYDVRSYTGVYRKRFELGIHDLTDTIVHDLSNTVRTNLNHDVEGRSRWATLSPRVNMSTSAPATAPPQPEHPANTRQSPEALAPPCPSPIRLEGDPNDPHTLLRAVFHYYCRFGRTGSKGANETTMDNANFSKLCRECPALLDASFTRTDVDLIFVKVKKKGERRINYTRFLDALGMIAIQKYPDMALEASVPMLLQVHIAKLPCVVEFTDGKQVQAVWSRRLEREHSHASSTSSAPSSPPTPSRRGSTPHSSPPKSSNGTTAPPPAPSISPRLNRRVSAPSQPPVSSSSHDLRRSKSEHNRPASSLKSTTPSPSKEEPSSKEEEFVTADHKSPTLPVKEEDEEEEGIYFAS